MLLFNHCNISHTYVTVTIKLNGYVNIANAKVRLAEQPSQLVIQMSKEKYIFNHLDHIDLHSGLYFEVLFQNCKSEQVVFMRKDHSV